MSRYIDADALIEFIDLGHYRNPLELCYSEQSIVDMIESRPTADVRENVHGEWVLEHLSQLWECTNCHEREIRTTDFCPNCGADMRKYLKHADNDTASGGLASAT